MGHHSLHGEVAPGVVVALATKPLTAHYEDGGLGFLGSQPVQLTQWLLVHCPMKLLLVWCTQSGALFA